MYTSWHFRRASSLILMIASLGIVATPPLIAQGTTPTPQELWTIIQTQQQEIEALKKRLTTMEGTVATTEEKIEKVADMTDGSGVASAASQKKKTTLGGYGELHYNNLVNAVPHGADLDQVDFHRFVLYVNHEFNDRLRFFSELEVEHSLTGDGTIGGRGKPGEVELEQAYLEYRFENRHAVKGGLFLIPVGILNETHEPPTFYGVERNPIETNIIPTTWWEAGVGFGGELTPGLSYDLAYTSGLAVNNTYLSRSGRQKVASAPAEDGAATARLKWSVPGLELAGTVHYEEDITQAQFVTGATRPNFNSSAWLSEAHVIWSPGPLSLKALYARWDLAKVDASVAGVRGRDEQYGWYVEPGFKLSDSLGLFVRFNEWDTNAGDGRNSRMRQVDYGVNWQPHEQVVLKLDYQDQQAPRGKITEMDGLNLGIGYQF